MNSFELSVDFNGIVLFDPQRLIAYFGGEISNGTNLHEKFTGTDAGDEVVRAGLVVPVLGINDGFYRVFVRLSSEDSLVADEWVVVENEVFPLEVDEAGSIVLADLAVFWEWEDEAGWNRMGIEPGRYGVAVRGFRRIQDDEVVDCGYEFVLHPQASLPPMTASLGESMQVLCLPEA